MIYMIIVSAQKPRRRRPEGVARTLENIIFTVSQNAPVFPSTQAAMAHLAMAQQEAARAYQPEVVNRHHDRNTLRRALRQDGRRNQGIEIMDVDDVRAGLSQKLAECFSGKRIMNAGKKS